MTTDIRAIATDLDGTLLGADGTLGARNRDALLTARDAGLEVILATARWYRLALPVADSLGLEGPLIACQGAEVRLIGEGTDLLDELGLARGWGTQGGPQEQNVRVRLLNAARGSNPVREPVVGLRGAFERPQSIWVSNGADDGLAVRHAASCPPGRGQLIVESSQETVELDRPAGLLPTILSRILAPS